MKINRIKLKPYQIQIPFKINQKLVQEFRNHLELHIFVFLIELQKKNCITSDFLFLKTIQHNIHSSFVHKTHRSEYDKSRLVQQIIYQKTRRPQRIEITVIHFFFKRVFLQLQAYYTTICSQIKNVNNLKFLIIILQ